MSKKIEKIQCKLISPFGPSILHGIMPPDIFEEFETYVYKILEEKESNHGDFLAGRIEDEYGMDENDLFNTRLSDFLDALVSKYATELSDRLFNHQLYSRPYEKSKMTYEVHRMQGWVNSMQTGEYNPLHYHPHCNVTTVFFFNDVNEEFIDKPIAESQTGEKNDAVKGNTDDGLIEIVYGSSRIMEAPTWRVRPAKGEFLIFPAYLLHVVYPFISKERRITASVNYKIQSSMNTLNFGTH